MNFPHRTKRGTGGFTLLEIIIVLMVFALILGGAITTVVLTASERALRDASSDIELLAKKARTASILHQRPYAIEFRENSLSLRPFVGSSESQRTTALGNEIGGTEVNREPQRSLHENLSFGRDIIFSIRHWNTSEFVTPSEKLVPIWRFDPNGLSEPVTIRMTMGESYAQDTYHPLSASIIESELEAK